jgi:signal transduction histidine kinase
VESGGGSVWTPKVLPGRWALDVWATAGTGAALALLVAVAAVPAGPVAAVGNLLAAALVASATLRLNRAALLRRREHESLGRSHGGLGVQLGQAQQTAAEGRRADHEFNNLLTIIAGHADLLLHQVAAGDPARESVSEVARAAERAIALTRQVLASRDPPGREEGR